MDARNSPSGRMVVVDVPGIPSDEVTVPRALAQHLRSIAEHGYELVVLNVEALTHPDSMTLGAIVQTYVTTVKSGGTVKLANVSKRFRELLTVTKIDRVIEIVEIAADAVRITIDPHERETSQTKIP